MLIISYMSRLNSSQVTLPPRQPHYLHRWWRISCRIEMLKYENWVYCPADDQYAPKKLQHDCVWLSHLKGFAYICDSLCNCLPALWNTWIWKCGELSQGESTARMGKGAKPRLPGGQACVPAALPCWLSNEANADKLRKPTFSKGFFFFISCTEISLTCSKCLSCSKFAGKMGGSFENLDSLSEAKRTVRCKLFPGMTWANPASLV